MAGREGEVRAGEARRGASALHPVHERYHRQAEGHSAHDGWLPHPRDDDRESDLRSQGQKIPIGAPPTSAGSPATPTSSTASLANGATTLHVRGRADPPRSRPLLGHHRAPRRDHLLHGAHGNPHLRAPRRRAPEEARPVVAAPAGNRWRAHQPRGVDVVPPRDRRQALPDRRHLVADGDRRHPDHAAARRRRHQARLRDAALPRHRRRTGLSRKRAIPRSRPTAASSCCASRGPACCAASGATRSATRRPTGAQVPEDATSRATAPTATRTATSGSWAASTM